MGSNPPQKVGRNYGRFKYPPTAVGLFRVNARSRCTLYPVARLSLSQPKARQQKPQPAERGCGFCVSWLASGAQYRYNEGVFIANPPFLSRNPLLTVAMVFHHYRQWLGAQVFRRRRDPFFTDPPFTV